MKEINEAKAALLYDYLDKSDMFYGLADKDSRSLMNVTFRANSEELNSAFVKAAGKNGIISIKGHRAIGGMRASLYNAMPIEGVKHLVKFMEEFEKSGGHYAGIAIFSSKTAHISLIPIIAFRLPLKAVMVQ